MPNPAVVSTPRREDTIGPPSRSEEPEPEPVDADPSRTSPERRRTDTEPVPKPPRRLRHECLAEGVLTLSFRGH